MISHCLLYIPTVIRFSRTLINVMGEKSLYCNDAEEFSEIKIITYKLNIKYIH